MGALSASWQISFRRRLVTLSRHESAIPLSGMKRRLALSGLPVSTEHSAQVPSAPEISEVSDSVTPVQASLALGSAVACAVCFIKRYYRTIKNTFAPRKEL